jgi:glutathione synthase/RimK-type ligase-like ATP-grasp enzyme
MIIGIHPDRIGEESYSEKWTECLRQLGAEVRQLNLLAQDGLDQARACDGVMWRWAHSADEKQSARRILYTIEHYLDIPVYPNTRTAWHFDEKIAQTYLLQALDAPTPDTWLFWNCEEAQTWARKAEYPLVFKLSSGAGSSNVIKVTDSLQAQELIRRSFFQGVFPGTMNEYAERLSFPRTKEALRRSIHRLRQAARYAWRGEYPSLPSGWFWRPEKGYALFQEFLVGNAFDTRITVIGQRAFGFRRMNRKDDFRASGSGLIEYDPGAIDPRCVEIAFETSKLGGFQSMAYDFLYKDGAPLICEISYAYADWAVHNCPGHWDFELNWIEGQMWPEEAQAEDFVNEIRLARGM